MSKAVTLWSVVGFLVTSCAEVAPYEGDDEGGGEVDLLLEETDRDGIRADLAPPTTSITSGPAWESVDTRARLEFAADEPARFECSLDHAPFVPCQSPIEYADLGMGGHQFLVRAIDLAGNQEPQPAEWSWRGCQETSFEIAAATAVSMCQVTGNKVSDARLVAFADPNGSTFRDVTGWTGYDLSSVREDLTITRMSLFVHHHSGFDNPTASSTSAVHYGSADHWAGSVVSENELRREAAISRPTDQYALYDWNELPLDLTAFDARADLRDGWISLGIGMDQNDYGYVMFYSSGHPTLSPYLQVEGYVCEVEK